MYKFSFECPDRNYKILFIINLDKNYNSVLHTEKNILQKRIINL